jgi:hypothetical protein
VRTSRTLRITFEWAIPPQAERGTLKGALQGATLRGLVFGVAAPVFLREMNRLGIAPLEAEVTVEYGARPVDDTQVVRVPTAKRLPPRRSNDPESAGQTALRS